ncbi:hypothetical protein PGTUg99_008148 [Puccinia graminis f. sp. tritici]|uniref:Uncharacterized protein n=1 Tax=Puccinia graminis f. sp. tritici TaxID=56615 RepID=A0A5B0P442_PUCGR|nr:hypothetical protein PGTUg99_008148 [Puccinia graminis f. sp. tritici]
MLMQCIAFSMQCIAFLMQCIAFSMRYRYMAIYRITSHRFTVVRSPSGCSQLAYSFRPNSCGGPNYSCTSPQSSPPYSQSLAFWLAPSISYRRPTTFAK